MPIGPGDDAQILVIGHPPGTKYRPDSTRPAHLLTGIHVHDNTICATGEGGHPTGVGADNGAHLAARDINFTGNKVQEAACE